MALPEDKQKRWRTLQDDEVDEIFNELVRAKIAEVVRASSSTIVQMGEGAAKNGAAKHSVDLNDKVTAVDWKWLDHRIRAQLKEAIDTKREDAFVLLTPQGYVDWWNSLFQAVIAISVLGAGFTFTIIFSDIAIPRGGISRIHYVRSCLIASWMLFVMSVAWASFASVVLVVNKTHVLNALAGGKKWYESVVLCAVTIAVLMQMMLPVGAFLAAAEAVRSYHNGFGIASLSMIGLIGFLMMLGWIMQNFVFSGPGKLHDRSERSERWRRRFGVYRTAPSTANAE